MTRVWRKLPLFMGVLLLAGICAYPQDSISARPGTINYVEGRAYLNGDEVMQRQIGRTSLNIDQYLRTADRSKAEVLLTPGVFLRLGESSEIRMVTPSLTDTKVAVTRGEVLVEVAQLYKGNHIEILNNGAPTVLLKNGL